MQGTYVTREDSRKLVCWVNLSMVDFGKRRFLRRSDGFRISKGNELWRLHGGACWMVPLVHTRTHELRERLDLQDTVICEKPNLIMVYVDFGQLNIVPFGGSL